MGRRSGVTAVVAVVAPFAAVVMSATPPADVPAGAVEGLQGTPAWESQPEHLVAVMDGRSVWPDDFEPAKAALEGADDGRPVRIVPSTSLMFLPVTVEGEDLPAGFQFAREKARA